MEMRAKWETRWLCRNLTFHSLPIPAWKRHQFSNSLSPTEFREIYIAYVPTYSASSMLINYFIANKKFLMSFPKNIITAIIKNIYIDNICEYMRVWLFSEQGMELWIILFKNNVDSNKILNLVIASKIFKRPSTITIPFFMIKFEFL